MWIVFPSTNSLHRLALSGLALAIAACGATSSAQSPTDSEIAKAKRVVSEWKAATAFNGVILVNESGKELIAVADGVADPVTVRQLTMHTRFQTGSIEKYFAALAVFGLIEEGKLELDTPISAYLPNYRADTAAQLTLRNILSNQSGLPNDIMLAFERIRNGESNAVDAISVRDAVAQFASGDLSFEPGEKFDYVLSNWLLVQHLLEEVTGLSYPEVRAHYVFDAAGMTMSGGYVHDLTETEPSVDDVAIGFDPDDVNGRGDYWTPRFFKGSYTTAGDLLKLEQALSSGNMLTPETVALFRTVQAPDASYAFGGRYRDWDVCGEAHWVSTQSGSNGATNITAAYDTKSGLGVSMLTNVDESQGEMFELSARLMGILSGCEAASQGE